MYKTDGKEYKVTKYRQLNSLTVVQFYCAETGESEFINKWDANEYVTHRVYSDEEGVTLEQTIRGNLARVVWETVLKIWEEHGYD